MKHGDSVEVYAVWAYAWPESLSRWFSGYEFVRYEGTCSIVQATRGIFAGIGVRFNTNNVRLKV